MSFCFDKNCSFCCLFKDSCSPIPEDVYSYVARCLQEQHLFRLSQSLWKEIYTIERKHQPFFLCDCPTLFDAVHEPQITLTTFETFEKLYASVVSKQKEEKEDQLIHSVREFLKQQETEKTESFLVVILIGRKEQENNNCFTQLLQLDRFADKRVFYTSKKKASLKEIEKIMFCIEQNRQNEINNLSI